jgi:hypothetical protein
VLPKLLLVGDASSFADGVALFTVPSSVDGKIEGVAFSIRG